MGKIEQNIMLGRRGVLTRKLSAAIMAHKGNEGTFNKIIFKRISFRRWLCVVEFEHDE